MTQYVYLLHKSDFVEPHQPIYKIGKTKQPNFDRFKSYPNGSVMLFQSSCRDCDELERKIRILFKHRYKWRKECGYEYFEGDQFSMIRDLCGIVQNEGVIQVEGLFNCIPCGLSTYNRTDFAKHRRTQNHVRRTQNPEEYAFRCSNCANTYRSKQSLRWSEV